MAGPQRLPAGDLDGARKSSLAYCGAVTHHLGVLEATRGRYVEADAHLAAAEATHQRMGAPLWLEP